MAHCLDLATTPGACIAGQGIVLQYAHDWDAIFQMSQLWPGGTWNHGQAPGGQGGEHASVPLLTRLSWQSHQPLVLCLMAWGLP